MSFLWYILIGILAGWVAGKIMRGGGFGLIVNLVVGIIGGLLGGWLFGLFGLIPVGSIGSFITSVTELSFCYGLFHLYNPNTNSINVPIRTFLFYNAESVYSQ